MAKEKILAFFLWSEYGFRIKTFHPDFGLQIAFLMLLMLVE
jgi:hypothetical protein